MIVSENEKSNILNYFATGDLKSVEKMASKLVNEGYSDPWLCNILGVTHAKQKKYNLAENYFKILTDLYPRNFNSFFNLANLYRDIGNKNKAIEFYNLSHKKNPEHLETICELAKLYSKTKKLTEAKNFYRLGYRIKPNDPQLMELMISILYQEGKFEESLRLAKKLFQISSTKDKFETEINVATNLNELGFYEDARKILLKYNDNNTARFNLSLIDFREGNFSKVWSNYECGIEIEQRNVRGYKICEASLPYWMPNKDFKSVLVLGEQGIGDEVMFSTILPDFFKLNNIDVSFFIDKRLKKLFQNTFPKHHFIEKLDSLVIKKHDSFIPLGSLAMYYRNSFENFSKSKKLIFKPDNNDLSKLNKIYNYKKKPIIGLAWDTANISHAKRRKVSLKKLLSYLIDLNCDFISLQYDENQNEIKSCSKKFKREIFLFDGQDNKNDLNMLAAKIALCDIVISIEGFTAEFASSLNADTLVILSKYANYRWMEKESSSVWFPSAKLFRQTKLYDWDNVLANIKEYCAEKLN